MTWIWKLNGWKIYLPMQTGVLIEQIIIHWLQYFGFEDRCGVTRPAASRAATWRRRRRALRRWAWRKLLRRPTVPSRRPTRRWASRSSCNSRPAGVPGSAAEVPRCPSSSPASSRPSANPRAPSTPHRRPLRRRNKWFDVCFGSTASGFTLFFKKS